MRPDTLAFLAEHARERHGVLTDRLVELIQAASPVYAESDRVSVADLRESCRDNLIRVLGLIAEWAEQGVQPVPPGAFDAARATGHRRAEQGLPLDAVLRSYRLGGRLIWQDLVDLQHHLDASDLREIGTLVWEVVDETSAQVAEAYHATETARLRADERRRSELWEGLLQGAASDPSFAVEAGRALSLDEGPYLVLEVLDGDPIDLGGRVPSETWLRRAGGSIGLICCPLSEMPALVAHVGEQHTHPVGISGPVLDLSTVDRGFRQAGVALQTLAGRPGTAWFDQVLPEALLRGSEEVARYLVTSWLGALLALPQPEQGELVETLGAWVETGGSTTATGSLVFCHRNTVINRIRRISQVIGRDLSGAVPPLELALAIRALASQTHPNR